MRKRTRVVTTTVIGVLVVGAVAAVVGPRLYRDYFSAPPLEVPTLMAKNEDALASQASGPLTADIINGEWIVAEGSEAGYRVDEKLNGVDVTVTGRGEAVSGSVTIDNATLTAADFTVEVASIKTDSNTRDTYFHNDALRVQEHPTATFHLTEPLTLETLPAMGESIEREVSGELTLAGVTRSFTFTVQARCDGVTTEIAAQIPITFSEFGVTAPNLGFVSVNDTGFVELELVLTHP